ncbi:MAG: type II secretion system protein GspM [Candidatus Dactylopiibacterium sp.]|nr:type II secretion system protein GspM [Candidatus Dactylopiibacterium sp.]
MKDKLLQLRGQALQYWQARNPRERLILACGGAVLLIALYVACLQAVQTRIATLDRRLPELLLNSYEIAAGGRAAAPAAPVRSSEDLRSELFRLLADQGVKAELRGLAADRVEARLAPAGGEVLLRQLNALRLASGSRVASLQLRSGDAPGTAELTAILERRP